MHSSSFCAPRVRPINIPNQPSVRVRFASTFALNQFLLFACRLSGPRPGVCDLRRVLICTGSNQSTNYNPLSSLPTLHHSRPLRLFLHHLQHSTIPSALSPTNTYHTLVGALAGPPHSLPTRTSVRLPPGHSTTLSPVPLTPRSTISLRRIHPTSSFRTRFLQPCPHPS